MKSHNELSIGTDFNDLQRA